MVSLVVVVPAQQSKKKGCSQADNHYPCIHTSKEGSCEENRKDRKYRESW